MIVTLETFVPVLDHLTAQPAGQNLENILTRN